MLLISTGINWYRPRAVTLWSWEGNRGRGWSAESSGRLLLDLWLTSSVGICLLDWRSTRVSMILEGLREYLFRLSQVVVVDWLSCSFVPLLTQVGHLGDVPQASLLAWYWKLNLTQQKHTFTNQKKCSTTQKIKPGLVVSYDIRPGNGEGLFWFWHFINLLTYFDTYPLSYSPRPT